MTAHHSTDHRSSIDAPPPPTIGILYPGHAAEDDYPAFEQAVGGVVRLPLVHTTIGVDEHTSAALLDTGSHRRLAEGAHRLISDHALDALLWACTSGSFVYGHDGAHEQARALGEAAGVPASSTSLAYLRALEALGVRQVAVAASYPEELAVHFRTLLAAAGVHVVQFAAHGIFTAAEVGLMSRDDVLAMVRAVDVPQAEAMLVPDTAMHSLRWIPDLEEALGKPVLTANQVTIWEGLRISGREVPTMPALGSLGLLNAAEEPSGRRRTGAS